MGVGLEEQFTTGLAIYNTPLLAPRFSLLTKKAAFSEAAFIYFKNSFFI
jgi:hypothetical protein